ncbi:MAG: serine hydrolase [Oscillospiraceae bacterium]|nr:serine hydrolase [Oscillospiraceae bacterium]
MDGEKETNRFSRLRRRLKTLFEAKRTALARRGRESMAAVCGAAMIVGAVSPAAVRELPVNGEGAWEIIREVIAEYDVPRDKIAVGFLNTVTGEECYYNGDRAFIGASLYKVALNMIWAKKVADGERGMDEVVWARYSLRVLQEGSLVNSNNIYATLLDNTLGNFQNARVKAAPYYGMTEEQAMRDRDYRETTRITPRRMIACLEKLYAEPELYPGVLDCLFLAEPGRYLRLGNERWPIAQKYGYIHDGGENFAVAGIVYAEEPFLLVVMVRQRPDAEELMSRLCARLGEYTEAGAAAPGS